MKIIPREKCGVRIYMGCEANIMDYDGNIDLKEYGLKGCDVVIASAPYSMYQARKYRAEYECIN